VADFGALFELLPIDRAMGHLLCKTPASTEATAWVEACDCTPAVKAALWLYVDELDKAHAIVQDLHTPTGAFLHAIVHRREGDFWNSKYWFRQAGHHPVISHIEHYEPYDLVQRADEAGGADPQDLIDLQRAEWKAIFDYAVQAGE